MTLRSAEPMRRRASGKAANRDLQHQGGSQSALPHTIYQPIKIGPARDAGNFEEATESRVRLPMNNRLEVQFDGKIVKKTK